MSNTSNCIILHLLYCMCPRHPLYCRVCKMCILVVSHSIPSTPLPDHIHHYEEFGTLHNYTFRKSSVFPLGFPEVHRKEKIRLYCSVLILIDQGWVSQKHCTVNTVLTWRKSVQCTAVLLGILAQPCYPESKSLIIIIKKGFHTFIFCLKDFLITYLFVCLF